MPLRGRYSYATMRTNIATQLTAHSMIFGKRRTTLWFWDLSRVMTFFLTCQAQSAESAHTCTYTYKDTYIVWHTRKRYNYHVVVHFYCVQTIHKYIHTYVNTYITNAVHDPGWQKEVNLWETQIMENTWPWASMRPLINPGHTSLQHASIHACMHACMQRYRHTYAHTNGRIFVVLNTLFPRSC